jgi:hypothetical protein
LRSKTNPPDPIQAGAKCNAESKGAIYFSKIGLKSLKFLQIGKNLTKIVKYPWGTKKARFSCANCRSGPSGVLCVALPCCLYFALCKYLFFL